MNSSRIHQGASRVVFMGRLWGSERSLQDCCFRRFDFLHQPKRILPMPRNKEPLKTLEEMVENRSNTYGFYEKYVPENCTECKGLGKTSREELTDYHKRDYSTFWEVCDKCGGEGRYVKHIRSVKIEIKPEEEIIPWSEFKSDHFNTSSSSHYFRLKVDKRDKTYERDYPELEKMSYDKYDEELNKIRMIEKLKRENKRLTE